MAPTIRLLVAFCTGLVGLLYLLVVIVQVANGGVEFSATVLGINELEAGADPSASHLEVEGGLAVFPLARPTLRRSRTDDAEGAGAELRFLSVPVVSPELWKDWQGSLERDERLDASTCRLVVSFTGEQVGELWPEVKRRFEADEVVDLTPTAHTVIGDTEPATNQISMPLSLSSARGLDPAAIRWMRYEQHRHGPWNLVKKLGFSLTLLVVSVLAFRIYRKLGDPSPPGGVSVVEGIDALETSGLIE